MIKNDDEYEKVINLSLSHGMAAIIHYLTRCLTIPEIKSNEIAIALKQIIKFYELHQNPIEYSNSYFPSWVALQNHQPSNSRMAWCYGDLGVGLTLYNAGEVLNDSNLKDLIVSQQDGVIKKILKSNYAKLVKEHQDKNTKWTDPDFPPNEASIGKGDDLPVKATWKRIPDVIPDPQFVSGKIEPSDILQGNIGDCYFLSAIAALAENDFRIK